MKKTVLLVSERFYPEEFTINDLATAWAEKGYKVKVLTQVPSYPYGKVFKGYKNLCYQKEIWNKISIYRIRTVTGYNTSLLKKIFHYINFIIFGSLLALFLARKSDEIFVYHVGPLTDAIPAVIIKKLFLKRITIWTLDIWPDAVFAFGFKRTKFREKALHLFVKFIYRNCDNILVSSRYFTDKLKLYASNKKIHYIPQWADEANSKCSPSLGNFKFSEEKKFHFTFAGNIGKVQNLANVIKAFASSENTEKIQLNLIGDGWNLPNILKIIKHNRYTNIISWGRKPSSDMPVYYGLSDVLVISLKSDPILELTVPQKFQAYLSAGKPIYAIMNGDVKKMVEEYELGITADPDNLTEIREGFEKFAAFDKAELNKFGANCESLYRDKFQKSKNIELITSILFENIGQSDA